MHPTLCTGRHPVRRLRGRDMCQSRRSNTLGRHTHRAPRGLQPCDLRRRSCRQSLERPCARVLCRRPPRCGVARQWHHGCADTAIATAGISASKCHSNPNRPRHRRHPLPPHSHDGSRRRWRLRLAVDSTMQPVTPRKPPTLATTPLPPAMPWARWYAG